MKDTVQLQASRFRVIGAMRVVGMTFVLVTCGLGCGDCSEPGARQVRVLCPSVDSGSVRWSVRIEPVSHRRIRLGGGFGGDVFVSDSSFRRQQSWPSDPWSVEHMVKVVEEPGNIYNIVFDGDCHRGTAGSESDAWELARIEYVRSVSVEIESWIKGKVLGPRNMVFGMVQSR